MSGEARRAKCKVVVPSLIVRSRTEEQRGGLLWGSWPASVYVAATADEVACTQVSGNYELILCEPASTVMLVCSKRAAAGALQCVYGYYDGGHHQGTIVAH